MCFIPSECFKATTSCFSHQQLVSEPRSSENIRVLGYIRIFQSCQKQVLIIPQCRAHPYELTAARISFIGDGGSPHASPEDSALFAHAPRGRRRLSHTRTIFEPFKPPKPSRDPGEPRAAPYTAPSRAACTPKEYSPNIPGST